MVCTLLSWHKNVVVFPSRAVAIENALRLFSPRLAIVDQLLTHHLPRNWLTSLAIEVCPNATVIPRPSTFILMTVVDAVELLELDFCFQLVDPPHLIFVSS